MRHRTIHRHGFTLFEVILSIALASVLLTLIGTAINLYLVQVDAGRTRVEEAQLARSILSMIADDIRATSVYQPQDTSSIAQLMAKTASFDVDSIDQASASGAADGLSQLGASGAATGTSGITSSTSGGSAGSTEESDTDPTLPLGLSGSLTELYVDATRLPKQEELFSSPITGYSNAQSPNSGGVVGSLQAAMSSSGAPATDLKTIHYFIRPGEAVEAGSASVTSLDPASQARAGGLVRQEIPRVMRNFAEKNGGSTVLDSNAVLLAPEVVQMQIRYFDGSQITDSWDMKTLKKLPLAVEVRIWLRSPNASSEPVDINMDSMALANTTHEYRQVVYLPMAQLASAGSAAGSTSSSTTDSSTSTDSSSTDSGSPSGDGSAFGNQ